VTVIYLAFGAGFSLSLSKIFMPLLIWGYKLLEMLFAALFLLCKSPLPTQYFKYFFAFEVISRVPFYRLHNAGCGIIVTDGLCR
jgi:hypothetical protein